MSDFPLMLQSWARSFLAAGLTVALARLQAGQPVNLTEIALAGAVAVLPVVIRWLDPADKAFGRGRE